MAAYLCSKRWKRSPAGKAYMRAYLPNYKKAWRKDYFLRKPEKLEAKRAAHRAHYARNRRHRIALSMRWLRSEKGHLHLARMKAMRKGAKGAAKITEAEWREILERQDGRCFYCKRPFSEGLCPTVDHIVPLSRCGRHEIGNIAAACRSCNCSKGKRDAPVRHFA